MILLVRYGDGTEESFDVSEHTKLPTIRSDGFLMFTTLAGGQVAINEEDVERVELGRVDAEERLLRPHDDLAA